MYQKNSAKILLGSSGLSKAIEVKSGVRQGDPLSPLLFNLSIEPLVIHLQAKLQGTTLLDSTFRLRLFADDVTLALKEKDEEKFLDTWRSYERASGAEANVQKSLFWSYPNNTEVQWLVKAGFQRIPTEESVRILGYLVKRNGSSDPTFWQKQLARTKQTLNILNQRAASLRGRSLCVKLKLHSLVFYHARLYPL